MWLGCEQRVSTFGHSRGSVRGLWSFAAVVVLAGVVSSECTWAEDTPPDRIVVRSEGGRGQIGIRCYIENYNRKSITFRTTLAGSLKSRPSELVIDVQTPQSKAHVKGLIEFTRRRFKQAQTEFDTALANENREWVRRELLAQLVRCALQLDDFSAACSRYVLLVKSDSDTRHAKLLPLVWSKRDLKVGLKANAKRWVAESNSVVQLIGASVLLADPAWSKKVEATLQGLTVSAKQSIRDLARMQLWRKRLLKGNLDHRDLADWQTQIDRLEASVRGGPYFLLGTARRQRRENEQAAAAFMWLPFVYDDDHHLAARACLEAADALRENGQKTQAATLYGEVTTRFADTAFAQEAKSQLQNKQ